MTATVQAIFFDLGETLLEFRGVNVRGVFEAGAKLAYGYLRKLGKGLPPFAEYQRRQYRAIRWEYVKSRLTRREFNSRDLLKRQARRMGHNLTDAEAIELARLYYEPLADHAVTEDGLPDMLRRFRDAGLTLGVISNTFIPPQVLDEHLARENLLELLPIRVYSCQVGVRKPNRKIFTAALREADVAAGNTMHVGDSPRHDIHGANKVGMISILKDPTGKYDLSSIQPKHKIRELTELPEIVAHYNGR